MDIFICYIYRRALLSSRTDWAGAYPSLPSLSSFKRVLNVVAWQHERQHVCVAAQSSSGGIKSTPGWHSRIKGEKKIIKSNHLPHKILAVLQMSALMHYCLLVAL